MNERLQQILACIRVGRANVLTTHWDSYKKIKKEIKQ